MIYCFSFNNLVNNGGFYRKDSQGAKYREFFLQWAPKSLSIIHRSPRLTTLYQDVLWMESAYVSYSGAKISEKVRSAANQSFHKVYSWLYSEAELIDLDTFADRAKVSWVIKISEHNLKNFADCLTGGLLTENEVKRAICKSIVKDLEENELIRLLNKYPEWAVGILARASEISSQMIERLLPLISSLPAEKRVQFLLILDQKTKEPLFVKLSDLAIDSKNELLDGIRSDLIHRALHIDSKDYLQISPQAYELRIQSLNKIIENSPLPQEEKDQLLAVLRANRSHQQRLLLQYLTSDEKEAVSGLRNHPDQLIVSELVQEGKWEELFSRYPANDRTLSYLLIAAYSEEKIDGEDLATAMMFHRVFCNTSENQRKLIPATKEAFDQMDNLLPKEKQEMLMAAERAKSNQRFLILVEKEAFDSYTEGLIFMTFQRDQSKKVPGFFESGSMFGMPAFGIAQAHYRNLAPVIHLAPSARAMEARIRANYSDLVLLFPEEAPSVHGSRDKTIFAVVHDFLHTNARNRRGDIIQNSMMDFIRQIEKAPECQGFYRNKMTDGYGSIYPKFREFPTQNEMVGFLLDRVIGEIIDGGYDFVIDPNSMMDDSLKDAFRNIIKCVIVAEFARLPAALVSPSFRPEVTKRVFERCAISEIKQTCSIM
jgi:hypothetical protein